MIPLFKPSFGDEELEALREPFQTGWIGLGPKTAEFEQKFAQYVGAKHAVALNSATAALHLSLLAFDIKPGDEILVPPLTFISTVHAVLYCGATPVFVDICPDTLCIDVEDLKRKITPRSKAVMPVHYGGHPCEMDEIMAIAQEHHLLIIEDAAHACGAEYKGHKIGSIGDTTCFSFHAVKNLATGDGGMITTNRLEIIRKLKRLRWVGIDKSTWERTEEVAVESAAGIRKYASYGWYYEIHDLGFKFHMNDIAAAIGLVQLEKLDKTNAMRREICERYTRGLRDVPWLETPIEHEYVRSAHHNYVIKTPYRDELNLYLRDKEIASGVHYMPAHLHPFYRSRVTAEVPVAEKEWKYILTIPLFPDLTDDQVDYIIETIRAFQPT